MMDSASLDRLSRDFFRRPTLEVAHDLLGKRLVKIEASGARLSGFIYETEAYIGREDLGCHARAGKTTRNASMWGPPGHAYVYFTYGMHWMLNFVTEIEGFPAAALIRGMVASEGKKFMRKRRGNRPDQALTDGPAKLCQALAIDHTFDGHDLCHPHAQLFLEHGVSIPDEFVTTGSRVGLNNVPEPWKSIAWRFQVHEDVFDKLIT